MPDAISSRIMEPICTEELVTTYMLKTCLMHAMSNDRLRKLLLKSLPYDIAYVLYRMLRFYVKLKGKLQFYFDAHINLMNCPHKFNIDYDDKLGCCLKRMLIVAVSEAILETLTELLSQPAIIEKVDIALVLI